MAPWGSRKLHLSAVAAAFISLVLSACTISLVSDYDEQTDTSLSQMNTETTVFINKMIAEHGTPAGTYANNTEFYATEEAKASTLVARAQAHAVLNSCPSTAAVKMALDAAGTKAQSEAGQPLSTVGDYLKSIPPGDCEVQLFNILLTTYKDLETFHQAQGDKGIPPSAHDPILVGGIGAVIFAGLAVEAAKKSAQSAQTGGGK